jgi:hypothetical protein
MTSRRKAAHPVATPDTPFFTLHGGGQLLRILQQLLPTESD